MSFKEKSPLVVALYLPQYYETEYNNKWWEKRIYGMGGVQTREAAVPGT